MATRDRSQKHDIAANWAKALNFIPQKGEVIVYDPDAENTLPRTKIGDGITPVNQLKFTDEDIIKKLDNMQKTLDDINEILTKVLFKSDLEVKQIDTKNDKLGGL